MERPENPLEIVSLSFKGKRLNKIPDWVFECKNLEWLDFTENNITEIPKELYKLTKLKALGITDKLTNITPGISKLQNLQELYLANNKIKEIPNELFKLKQLEILEINTSNSYEILSEKIINLKNLKKLKINNKKLRGEKVEIPENILEQSRTGQVSFNAAYNGRIIHGEGDPTPIFEYFKSQGYKPEDYKPKNITQYSIKSSEDNISLIPRISPNEDLLSRKDYADALSLLISNKNTIPPLNIGIYAKWGEGKTHLMELIKKNLNNEENIIVDFDAWEYEDQEKIWAGLIEAILKKYKNNVPDSYWKFMEWKTQKQATPENAIKFSFSLLLWFAIYWGIMWLLPNDNTLYEFAFKLSSNLWSLAGFWLLISFLTLISPSLIQNPFVNLDIKFLKYLEAPTYKENLGFREEIKELIDFAVKELTSSNKRLVLFIDNLDRCSQENIVKVLDSICLFLGSCNEANKLNIISLLAIDYDIVKKAIKNKIQYDVKEKLDFKVEEYLDKIINFPFFIPREENIKPLLCKFLSIPDEFLPTILKNDAKEQIDQIEKKPLGRIDYNNNEKYQIKIEDIKEVLIELTEDDKFYIKEVLQYLHENVKMENFKEFTPRMINKFINQYFVFKYLFIDKIKNTVFEKYENFNEKLPKWLAWWFGLGMINSIDILNSDFFDYVVKGHDKPDSVEIKERVFENYYNNFKKDFYLEELINSEQENFLEILKKESAIFTPPKDR